MPENATLRDDNGHRVAPADYGNDAQRQDDAGDSDENPSVWSDGGGVGAGGGWPAPLTLVRAPQLPQQLATRSAGEDHVQQQQRQHERHKRLRMDKRRTAATSTASPTEEATAATLAQAMSELDAAVERSRAGSPTAVLTLLVTGGAQAGGARAGTAQPVPAHDGSRLALACAFAAGAAMMLVGMLAVQKLREQRRRRGASVMHEPEERPFQLIED